jgi:hypothetical protein
MMKKLSPYMIYEANCRCLPVADNGLLYLINYLINHRLTFDMDNRHRNQLITD